VKGPKPVILIGNFADILFKQLHKVEEERLQKYGNIYGFVFRCNQFNKLKLRVKMSCIGVEIRDIS